MSDNGSLSSRLKKTIVYTGLTQRQFAKEIGISENFVSVLLNKNTRKLSDARAFVIEKKFGVSAKWLLRNEGSMIKTFSQNINLDPVKKKLISKIEKLTEEQAAAVLSFIYVWEETNERN